MLEKQLAYVALVFNNNASKEYLKS